MREKVLSGTKLSLFSNVPDWSFFIALEILLIMALLVFWQKQQENVDIFNQQLTEFSDRVNSLPASSSSNGQLEEQNDAFQAHKGSSVTPIFNSKSQQEILSQKTVRLKQQISVTSGFSEKEKISLVKDWLSIKKDQVNSQNAVYVSLIQALGSLFFIVTAYFTWRSTKTAEANLKATQEKQETDKLHAEANLRATEEKQVTERFSKAIELLGHEKLEVRIGGIYSLERIAKDSKKDYWTVMEVMTAFVREKSHTTQPHGSTVPDSFQTDEDENGYYDESCNSDATHLRVATDIQAVLTVLSQRKQAYWKGEENRLNLTESNFSWLIFPTTINFRDMNLALANFRKAILDEVDLTGAQLTGAYFTEAKLRKTILVNANFVEAKLPRADLEEANLENADIRNANLTRANLKKANFRGAKLIGSILTGTCLEKTDFRDADLSETYWGLEGFSGSDKTRAASIIRSHFSQAITNENTKLPDYLLLAKSV